MDLPRPQGLLRVVPIQLLLPLHPEPMALLLLHVFDLFYAAVSYHTWRPKTAMSSRSVGQINHILQLASCWWPDICHSQRSQSTRLFGRVIGFVKELPSETRHLLSLDVVYARVAVHT
jgi:hypothetical protein